MTNTFSQISKNFALVIVVFSILVSHSSFAQTLVAKIDLESIKVNKGLVKTYEEKLTRILGINVVVTTANVLKPDILVSTSKNIPNSWKKSTYSLDNIPSFIEVSLHSTLPPTGIIGQTRGLFEFQSSENMRMVANPDVAIQLLKKGRIDRVISYYSEEKHFLMDKMLHVKNLNNPTALFVAFRSNELLKVFDDKVLTSNVETLVNTSDLTLPTTDQENTVYLHVFFKYYDSLLNKLMIQKEEENATLWYKEKLPQFNVVPTQGSLSDGFKALKEQPNVCLLNVYKKKEREDFVYFTKPTIGYLNERVYTIKGSNEHKTIEDLLSQGKLDIDELLLSSSHLIIGLNHSYLNSLPEELRIAVTRRKESFVDTKSISKEVVLDKLVKGTLDYFIELPNKLPADVLDSNIELASFPIANVAFNSHAHIACSKSDFGLAVVRDIDKLLDEKVNRMELARIMSDRIEPSSKKDALAVFNNLRK